MASGDHQNTDRKPSGKKVGKLSQKEQSERFKEAARELGADLSSDAFDHIVQQMAKEPPAKPK